MFQPGERVWYAGAVKRQGCDSELHVVDERIVARAPDSLDDGDAAALPLTAITAWELLFDRIGVKPDAEQLSAVESTAAVLRELGHEVSVRELDWGITMGNRILARFMRGIHDTAAEQGHAERLSRRARGLARIALRPVGTAHGGLSPAVFLRLLTQACYTTAELGTTLRRVFLLISSPDEMERYQALLKAIVEKAG